MFRLKFSEYWKRVHLASSRKFEYSLKFIKVIVQELQDNN